MIKVLHLADVHLGSGLAYGRINPATGLNTRLEDFGLALKHCVDAALERAVDLVLFGGDAFPDATPPPLHQEIFARQFRRLADARIPTVLVVGNHDQHGQGQEGSSLSIYRTLGVSGFWVGDKLQTFRIETASGPVQVTTLPWLNRSTLLARQESIGQPSEAIAHQLLQRLHLALEAEIRGLDPDLPAILLAHAMLDTAKYGSERHLAVGKGFSLPLPLLARPAYQYVALGHVHKHQVLCQDPLVIYPGSIERVDFGEEHETKGFVVAEVERGGSRYEFIALPSRDFRTIRVDVTGAANPQARILEAIRKHAIEAAVVRVQYRIRADQLDTLDERALHAALSSASSYTIAPDLVTSARTRLPRLDPAGADPLPALEQYLQTRPDLAGLRADMLAAAQALLAEDAFSLAAEDPPPDEGTPAPQEQQLRLL